MGVVQCGCGVVLPREKILHIHPYAHALPLHSTHLGLCGEQQKSLPLVGRLGLCGGGGGVLLATLTLADTNYGLGGIHAIRILFRLGGGLLDGHLGTGTGKPATLPHPPGGAGWRAGW